MGPLESIEGDLQVMRLFASYQLPAPCRAVLTSTVTVIALDLYLWILAMVF